MRFTSLRSRTRGDVALMAAALLVGAPVVATVAHAQQPVRIFLSAVDEGGEPITDLRAEEVAVQVDGADCPTTRFEAIDWPTKLTVMVDNGPVHVDALRQLREALRLFFGALPTDIEVSLLSIDPAPRWIYKPGKDRIQLLKSIDLLIPDHGAPRFIDALAEAAERAAKDRSGKERDNFFPVFLIVGSSGVEGSLPRDYEIQRMFKQIAENATTVHVVMLDNPNKQLDIGTGTSQIEVGIRLTELTGGRYEAINSNTRLSTLLPEYARQIARSHARQSHQYRITCQPPAGSKAPRISAATVRPNISAALTLDGRVP